MKIVPVHRKQSEPVVNIKDIIDDANAMSKLLNADDFKGTSKQGLALHHSQVSENPKSFFVVHRKFTALFGSYSIIMNPKILERHSPKMMREGCLSFPYRLWKDVRRYREITVEFDVENRTGTGLVHVGNVEEDGDKPCVLRGLAAEIFQHEYDHGHASYIYDKDK